MKKLLILFSFMVFSLTLCATVRTVSNNPSTLGQFNTIQAAIDASADSDTVYVYGSPNTYAAFIILDKKRITVIGPGWSPDKNLPLLALVAGAQIRNSPAGGSPDGSELHGLVFTTTVNPSLSAVGGDLGVNNIRFVRCQFSGSINWDLAASGHLIEGSILYSSLNFNASLTYQNFLFQNNLFFFPVGAISAQLNNIFNTVNVRFDHNLFYSSNNAGGNTVTVLCLAVTARFHNVSE
jgi:hypothetical protein